MHQNFEDIFKKLKHQIIKKKAPIPLEKIWRMEILVIT